MMSTENTENYTYVVPCVQKTAELSGREITAILFDSLIDQGIEDDRGREKAMREFDEEQHQPILNAMRAVIAADRKLRGDA